MDPVVEKDRVIMNDEFNIVKINTPQLRSH